MAKRERPAVVRTFTIEPGTLLVLTDVEIEQETYELLVETIAEIAGHREFAILRVSSGDVVTKFGVNDVLRALGKDV